MATSRDKFIHIINITNIHFDPCDPGLPQMTTVNRYSNDQKKKYPVRYKLLCKQIFYLYISDKTILYDIINKQKNKNQQQFMVHKSTFASFRIFRKIFANNF